MTPMTDGGTGTEPAPEPEAIRVLVVDDEERVAEAYRMWLSEYDVEVATGGREALSMVDEDVDVVLLDRRMPDLTGDEVLAEIRERGLDPRVAMVTAVDPDFDVVDMAFDDYLTKPVTAESLSGVVDRLAALSDYDTTFEAFYAVNRKLAALEAEKPAAALDDEPEYRRLQERKARLSEELDAADADGDASFAALMGTVEDPGQGGEESGGF